MDLKSLQVIKITYFEIKATKVQSIFLSNSPKLKIFFIASATSSTTILHALSKKKAHNHPSLDFYYSHAKHDILNFLPSQLLHHSLYLDVLYSFPNDLNNVAQINPIILFFKHLLLMINKFLFYALVILNQIPVITSQANNRISIQVAINRLMKETRIVVPLNHKI